MCHKKGHHAKDCKSKDKSGGNKFQGKCNNCGKIGHKETDCWDKAENINKKPAWYKPKNEVMAAAVEKDKGDEDPKVEFLMCGMEFPQQAKLLQDPNVWIAGIRCVLLLGVTSLFVY